LSGDFLEVIGNGPSVTGVGTDFIVAFDVSAYSGFLLHLNGTFGLTLQAQFTNDLTQPFVAENAFNINTTSVSASLNAVGLYYFHKAGRFLRIRCTAFTSNTSLIGILECLTTSIPITTNNATVILGSTQMLQAEPLGVGSGSGLAMSGAVQTNANGTATAGVATATLTGVATRFTYLTAMEVTVIDTATAGNAELTLSGLAGGSLLYEIDALGVVSGSSDLVVNWGYPGLQSSAVNTNIVATLPSLGAGTGKVSICLHGYTL